MMNTYHLVMLFPPLPMEQELNELRREFESKITSLEAKVEGLESQGAAGVQLFMFQ
jgi:hypothetical protein